MKVWPNYITVLSSLLFLSTYSADHRASKKERIAQRKKMFSQIERVFSKRSSISETLTTAYELFEQTPGFNEVLQKVLDAKDYGNQKGFLFEIEKAVDLELSMPNNDKPAYTVIAFGEIITSPVSQKYREFDIVAECGDATFYFECKNRSWHRDPGNKCEQFHDQKAIIDTMQSGDNPNVHYVIASKKSIPSRWKEYFAEHNIAFEDKSHYHNHAEA
jgi:hypothetical protein